MDGVLCAQQGVQSPSILKRETEVVCKMICETEGSVKKQYFTHYEVM